MTEYKPNITESIDNLNSLEERVKKLEEYTIDNIAELVKKIDYLYELAGGE